MLNSVSDISARCLSERAGLVHRANSAVVLEILRNERMGGLTCGPVISSPKMEDSTSRSSCCSSRPIAPTALLVALSYFGGLLRNCGR